MTRSRPFLSKSRLLSARQCLKRLHLEVHRPELGTISAQAEAAFRTGHRVGDVARRIYGTPGAVLVPYEGGLAHALRKTARLLRERHREPIFEATFQQGGVLVRIDLLLPEADGWRIVEVKSSTSLKDEHVFDCAVQSWVFRGLGHSQTGIALAHVDNRFVYRGDDDYRGLLTEVDIANEVVKLLPGVPEWVGRARVAAGDQEPVVAVGAQCNLPYDCPFMGHCWPSDTEFPVQQLPQASKAKLGSLIARGFRDLRQVPPTELSETQRRVQRVAAIGRPELLDGARRFARELAYPRYYLDFETIAPAVPVWPDTRPYEALPVQWSCHYEGSPGQIEHAEFLDLSGEPPLRRLAQSLIRVVGSDGPVLTYSNYERVVIDTLRRRLPDLDAALGRIRDRLVDLQPVTQANFYHPEMAGSWSLKAVLPHIEPPMSYQELPEIQDGTAASEGYLEAIDPATTAARRSDLEARLKRYCRFDTEGLVSLVQFFARG